ncbi:MAG: PspC domain-containing protein [Chromatocurvus sp.]
MTHDRYDRNQPRNGQRETLDTFRARKRRGWDLGLYRNTRSGKVAGVAAGIADYWDVAHWVVRLLWIAAFLFTGTLSLWAYLAGWLLLAPRRDHAADAVDASDTWVAGGEGSAGAAMEYDEDRHDFRPRKAFRYSDSASQRLRKAQERLDAASARVQRMETYVTSRQYALNKEFSRL